MKTTKHEAMYQKIEKHGENLNRIFKTDFDNITLCKKLFRIENRLHYLAEQYCNGKIEETKIDKESEKLLDQANKILQFRFKEIPVFFNQDPRGYALKIKDDYIRDNHIEIERDLGGYGILAPDFRNN